MNVVKSFEDLEVWKKAIDISDLTHAIVDDFPKQAIWTLGTQMLRSSVSIGSNIAEGCERQHTPEYIQFCYIALGSCAELYTQLIIAKRRKYLPEEKYDQISEMIQHERRMLLNLTKSLKLRRKQ